MEKALMASNGVAVALPVEPISSKVKPAAPPVAIQIGEAMADACEALGRSLADLDAGGLTAANRARGGETIAAVVEMQLAHFGAFDFGAVASATGRHALLQRHGTALRQLLGAGVPEEAITGCIDELLSQILAVANKVAAVERVFREH
jgi:hypothetical protein